ncbi:MAG: arginine deiminase family protein [Sneathiella sp.]
MPAEFNEFSKLAKVLVKSPLNAFVSQSILNDDWLSHNYLECPDLECAINEHARFVAILREAGVETLVAPENSKTSIDSLYMRDSSLMTPHGMILCNMGKGARRAESAAVRHYYESNDIPVLGEITAPGTIEGGDLVWFDENTLAVADGYRTNPEGIKQLSNLLPDVEVIAVPLPHWNGPSDVLHLMSFISPVDKDLAVIYPRMMPVPFMNWLKNRNINFVEVPDTEYDSMGCNVLALSPRNCVMIEGNPITQSRLEEAGCTVQTYAGRHISYLGSGGPTCLTRPLTRIK